MKWMNATDDYAKTTQWFYNPELGRIEGSVVPYSGAFHAYLGTFETKRLGRYIDEVKAKAAVEKAYWNNHTAKAEKIEGPTNDCSSL